jgi:hypothetical protein
MEGWQQFASRATSLPIQLPMKVLCLVAGISGASQDQEKRYWETFADAMQGWIADRKIALERLAKPSEAALRAALAEPRDVLHLVVRGEERGGVHFATLLLQSSDGSQRSITAQSLAGFLAGYLSLRLVVLQPFDAETKSLRLFGEMLGELGVPAVIATSFLDEATQKQFVTQVFGGVLAGRTPAEITQDFNASYGNDEVGEKLVIAAGKAAQSPLIDPGPSEMTDKASSGSPVSPPIAPLAMGAETETPAANGSAPEKKSRESYDVFLCHNSADRHAILDIARRLRRAGKVPWLDVWEMPPGRAWQPLLEERIGHVRSAAVFVGPAGIGPWQRQEIQALLTEFVAQGLPVIPVLLPGAPSKPELPLFLRAVGWVDFRQKEPGPFMALIWGISGEKPVGYTD